MNAVKKWKWWIIGGVLVLFTLCLIAFGTGTSGETTKGTPTPTVTRVVAPTATRMPMLATKTPTSVTTDDLEVLDTIGSWMRVCGVLFTRAGTTPSILADRTTTEELRQMGKAVRALRPSAMFTTMHVYAVDATIHADNIFRYAEAGDWAMVAIEADAATISIKQSGAEVRRLTEELQ